MVHLSLHVHAYYMSTTSKHIHTFSFTAMHSVGHLSGRAFLRLGSASVARAAPSSRGLKRQLYTCCFFHFFGSNTSHCSPAASSNSGSASHAQSTAPAGRIVLHALLRLLVTPSAICVTRPVAQISCGSLVSLSWYFHKTSGRAACPRAPHRTGRRLIRLQRLDAIGDASFDAPLPLRVLLLPQLVRAEDRLGADRARIGVGAAQLPYVGHARLRRRRLCRQAAVGVRREARSSSTISSSSEWRWATVPMRSSAFDDQRVAYWVQPRLCQGLKRYGPPPSCFHDLLRTWIKVALLRIDSIMIIPPIFSF